MNPEAGGGVELNKADLSPEQTEHWQRQLEAAERAVKLAKTVLGIINTDR